MEVFASFFPSSLHISHHRAHSTLDHKLGGGDCCGLAQITVFVRAQPHFSPFLFDEVDRPINHILLSYSLTTVPICSVDLAITGLMLGRGRSLASSIFLFSSSCAWARLIASSTAAETCLVSNGVSSRMLLWWYLQIVAMMVPSSRKSGMLLSATTAGGLG